MAHRTRPRPLRPAPQHEHAPRSTDSGNGHDGGHQPSVFPSDPHRTRRRPLVSTDTAAQLTERQRSRATALTLGSSDVRPATDALWRERPGWPFDRRIDSTDRTPSQLNRRWHVTPRAPRLQLERPGHVPRPLDHLDGEGRQILLDHDRHSTEHELRAETRQTEGRLGQPAAQRDWTINAHQDDVGRSTTRGGQEEVALHQSEQVVIRPTPAAPRAAGSVHAVAAEGFTRRAPATWSVHSRRFGTRPLRR